MALSLIARNGTEIIDDAVAHQAAKWPTAHPGSVRSIKATVWTMIRWCGLKRYSLLNSIWRRCCHTQS